MKTPRFQQAVDFIVREWHAEIKRLEGLIASVTGGTAPTKGKKAKAAPKAKKSGKKRTRRSTEDMDKEALAIVAFVKSKGSAGAKGKEITAKFGPLLPSIKEHVNTRAVTKNALKSKGAGSQTVYLA